jgi:hypothetical protein
VALQDLDQARPHSRGEATGDDAVRATSRWHIGRAIDMPSRRPRPPSRGMRRAHMPRRAFLVLAFGWASALVLLLAAALATRWLG